MMKRIWRLPEEVRDAFDLTKEPRKSYDKYNAGRFGLGCLLARRLTEAGARFIEVTTEPKQLIKNIDWPIFGFVQIFHNILLTACASPEATSIRRQRRATKHFPAGRPAHQKPLTLQ